MLDHFATKYKDASKAIEEAFKAAIEKTGAIVDSDTARAIKQKAVDAFDYATRIGKNLADVNGDGKIDEKDLKAAAEKVGIVWDKIDPEVKEALIAGAVTAGAVFLVPIVGNMLAIPAFAFATAYFYIMKKLKSLR